MLPPNDESLSIELEDEDLLDIDGSDDPTAAFSAKKNLGMLMALRAPAKKNRATVQVHEDEHPTVMLRDVNEDGDRATIPVPMHLLAPRKSERTPPAAAANPSAKMAPKSPTISPAPPVKTKRNATSSYPPIAINVSGHRDRAMSFISERPSRAGWITAAVIGALLLIGASAKVAAPKAHVAPPPVAAAPPPAPLSEPDAEPKVVTFGDGISIKPKAEASKAEASKADAKPDVKKPAPHFVAKAPAKAPATTKLPDGSLSLNDKKDIPATSHDSKSERSDKPVTAEQKKLKSIEQQLAEAQLKAAER